MYESMVPFQRNKYQSNMPLQITYLVFLMQVWPCWVTLSLQQKEKKIKKIKWGRLFGLSYGSELTLALPKRSNPTLPRMWTGTGFIRPNSNAGYKFQECFTWVMALWVYDFFILSGLPLLDVLEQLNSFMVKFIYFFPLLVLISSFFFI